MGAEFTPHCLFAKGEVAKSSIAAAAVKCAQSACTLSVFFEADSQRPVDVDGNCLGNTVDTYGEEFAEPGSLAAFLVDSVIVRD